MPVAAVSAELSVREDKLRFSRLDASTWRVESEGASHTLVVDERGLPVFDDGAGDWPLERDAPD